MLEKKEIQGNVQELIPIKKIENGKIILNDNNIVFVYKIEPTNFKLKTLLEQEAILEGYKLFLKRCNFNMQIIIQTQKRDLNEYIQNMKNQIKTNHYVRESLNDYINFLKEISNEKKIVSKSFYIIVEKTNLDNEDIFIKLKDGLSLCDNEIKICNYNEIIKITKNYLNK